MEIKWSGEISYAHVLSDLKSKCFRLHGHNTKVEVEVDGIPDESGKVYDFNNFGEILKVFDHKMIVCEDDVTIDNRTGDYIYNICPGNPKLYITFSNNYINGYKPLLMLSMKNVTAENLAEYVLKLLLKHADVSHLKKISVYWWEDSRSYAKAEHIIRSGIK